MRRKGIGVLVACAALTSWAPASNADATAAPRDADPTAAQEGGVTATQVADNLWRIDGAIDVIVVQTGPDGLLMVDTGYPFAEPGVRAQLLRLAGKDHADVLIDTHWHHAFSNHLYGAGAKIIAHASVPGRMASTKLMAGALVEPMPAEGMPTETFSDSLSLRYNGEDISILHLPGAHTDGDAVVFFREAKVVLTGDLFVPHMPWTDIDSGGDPAQLLPAVDTLLALIPRDAVIVAGHDRTATYEDLVAFRDMLKSANDSIRARVDAGWSLRSLQSAGLPWLSEWRGDVPEALFAESLYRRFSEAESTEAPTLELRNGHWLEEGRFVDKTVYSVAGVLRASPPERVDRTLDLGGGWVIPPFAEAHTHRLAEQLQTDAADFVRQGVLYAMVQDPIVPVTEEMRDYVSRPQTPDVIYTQGVVTPSYGVMPTFYRAMVEGGAFGEGVTFDDLDGDVLFTIDSVEELQAEWPELRRRNDRFIKVIVAFADEIDLRKDDLETYRANPPLYSGRPGVRPEVLTRLVELAHEAGLRVSAHIETAADFRLAVRAGADFIAHMPASWQIGEGAGYGAEETAPWLVTPEDALAARLAGVAVITTATPLLPDDPRTALMRRVHRQNLTTLREAGAKLLVGSDQFVGTSVDEALFLASLGVLSNEDIVQLLAVQTPRVLFPDRKIGHLRDGWEATFLVLGEDPFNDLQSLRDVRLRVKQGWVLQ